MFVSLCRYEARYGLASSPVSLTPSLRFNAVFGSVTQESFTQAADGDSFPYTASLPLVPKLDEKYTFIYSDTAPPFFCRDLLIEQLMREIVEFKERIQDLEGQVQADYELIGSVRQQMEQVSVVIMSVVIMTGVGTIIMYLIAAENQRTGGLLLLYASCGLLSDTWTVYCKPLCLIHQIYSFLFVQRHSVSSTNSLRLYNPHGSTATQGGMLQICISNRWRAVCDYTFGCSTEGRAACRQLGYSGSQISKLLLLLFCRIIIYLIT